MQKSLTKTLTFQLNITEGSQQLLNSGQLEARRVTNEIYRLDNEGYNWNDIEHIVANRSKHVKNTTQQLFDKATDTLKRYYDENDYGRPRQNYYDKHPLRMNHGEGYKLTSKENGQICFRVTALKRRFVRGTLQGRQHDKDLIKLALHDEEWRVGTAELIDEELHITITHTNAEVMEKSNTQTVVGVDVNEDCVGLTAMTGSNIEDSIVIEYPEIKKERHKYFTIRKRMQSAGQTSLEAEIQDSEKQFVQDSLHQVSREIVNWVERFESPVIVFEDLKDMRDSIEFGSRMNRRLHSLPFAQLQEFVSYKAAWNGIPTEKINPEHTSQECITCGFTSKSNRRGKRFKCIQCGFQDHADRKASVSIGAKGLEKLDRNVPALNKLPVVRTTEGCDGRQRAV